MTKTFENDPVRIDKGDTWPKVLRFNHGKYGRGRRAMRSKHHGIWQPYTWTDYYVDVKYLALGLLSLGFEPGDKLLIIGDNAPHWYYAELAAQANHGVSVGAYSELTPPEIRYVSRNSEVAFAVVEGQEQVDKLLQIKEELPLLRKVIYWSYKGLAHYNEPALIGYRQVLELGKEYEKSHPGIFEKNVETGKADDVCAIVYTSGTTGAAPKGAVHTFRTMRAGADAHMQFDPWHEKDNVVPYLPPAWMNEQWLAVACHLLSASTLNFAEAPETQQRDTRETSPSIVFYGSRLWESQAAMVQARILRADAVNRLIFRLLMPVGYRMVDLRRQKKRPGLFLKVFHAVAEAALFRPIKASLGLSNARICYTSGAVLSPDAFRFYHALNLPLKSLYTTTEGGTLADGNNLIGPDTEAPVQEGAQVRINGSGELMVRQSSVFVGYYKDPDGTAQVLRDGWFFSGDHCLIRDGRVVFVDRLKDIVELACGEKLAPQSIESRLRFSPYIKDAWIVTGPRKEYISAIIVINYDNVSSWAGQRRVAYTDFADLSQKPEIYGLIRTDVERVNQDLPAGARVKKIVLLHKEFDPDEGELTRTRKLRKTFLEEHYRYLIEAIYSDRTEVPIETRVMHHDGRIGTKKTVISIKPVERAA